MRTANTNNYTVEALVAKYRNFVKENTPMEIASCEGEDFDVPSSDIDASSDQQLIVSLYRSVAEKNANKEVLAVLSDYSEHFYKDVLNDDEFAFLCEHFPEVIEYEFTHRTDWHCPYIHMHLGDWYEKLEDIIIERIPFKDGQTVFIPDAGYCDLAVRFKGCVVKGYTSIIARRFKEDMNIVWALGQIRLYAAGIQSEIVPYINLNEEINDSLVQDTNLVDLVVCLSFSNEYDKLYNLLNKGGQMFLFAKRDDLVYYARYKAFRYKKMGKEFDEREKKSALTRKEFLNKLIKSRAIQSLVSYNDKDTALDVSVDSILLHIEKKNHSTVVVESINRGIIAKVNPSVLDANLLWPGYYLANRPKEGKPLSSLVKLFNTEHEVVEQYWAREDKGIKLSGDLLVLAPKQFGDRYADACMDDKDLTALSDPMFEGWEPHMLSIHQPGVGLLGNTEKLVLGYVKDDPTNKFVCIDIVPYLLPKRNIDVRYIAALLLSPEVKEQILTICDGSITAETMSLILDRIIVPKHTPKERIQFLAEANYDALLSTQQELKKNHEDYKKAVRMRKHALTQKLSSFKEKFSKLNAFRMRNGGKLNDEDTLSRITGSKVKDAFEFLSSIIDEMMPVIEHIADVDYSFKNPERIIIKSFIEDYIAQKNSGWLNFKPVIAWKDYYFVMSPNNISNEIKSLTEKYKSLYDDTISSDILFFSNNTYKNESFDQVFQRYSDTYSIWFPPDALTLVLDNIVSNALAHAFTDESRTDYMLRFSLKNDSTELSLIIENNGTPIPEDRDVISLFEYGVSSALHQNGHNGIGCNEIDDIMRRYGGKVELVSTPNDEFTVKYILSFSYIYESKSGNKYYTKYLDSIIQYLQEKNKK